MQKDITNNLTEYKVRGPYTGMHTKISFFKVFDTKKLIIFLRHDLPILCKIPQIHFREDGICRNSFKFRDKTFLSEIVCKIS